MAWMTHVTWTQSTMVFFQQIWSRLLQHPFIENPKKIEHWFYHDLLWSTWDILSRILPKSDFSGGCGRFTGEQTDVGCQVGLPVGSKTLNTWLAIHDPRAKTRNQETTKGLSISRESRLQVMFGVQNARILLVYDCMTVKWQIGLREIWTVWTETRFSKHHKTVTWRNRKSET